MSKFKRLKNEKQIKAGLYIRVLSNAYGMSIDVLKVMGKPYMVHFKEMDYSYMEVKVLNMAYGHGMKSFYDSWSVLDLLGYGYESAVYPFSTKLLSRLLKMNPIELVEYMGENKIPYSYLSTLNSIWGWEREADSHFDY